MRKLPRHFGNSNSAAGNLLRGWPAADPGRIVLVYDQLRVKRIEL